MPIAEPPALTPFPTTPPSTSDPANFDARGDALLGHLPTNITEQNALANWMEDAANAIETDADAASASATNANNSAIASAASATASDNAKTAAQAAATAAGAAAGLPALVNDSILEVSSSGVLRWIAKSAVTFWLAATGGLAKALAFTYLNKGTIAASGSSTILFSDAESQRVQASGNITINLSGWPAPGRDASMRLECVNFSGTVTITTSGGTIYYVIPGGYTTTLSASGIQFQAANSTFLTFFTTTGGTKVYCKAV